MIPAEAVEAAEEAAHDALVMWKWSEMDHHESREFFTRILEAAAPHMMSQSIEGEALSTATFTEADVYVAAKHLATVEGDAWVFEPPKMDGATRGGTAKEVYLRIATGALEAITAQRANPTPGPDHV